jgi:glycosyltransferase involved in cell wall biosynthesis
MKKKLKILMLVPFLPNISTSGGQTRWYNILKYLSKDHEITLYSLIKDDSEKKFISPLKKYCKKVKVFKRPKSPWTLRNILLTIFTWYPLLVVRNFSLGERRALRRELEEEKYDLIHAETFYVMPHLPKTTVPTILVDQTIEYLVYKHYVSNEVPLILRPLFMLDVFKLRFWEKYYWRRTNKLVAVSSEDKKIMESEIAGIDVEVIPNGIDADYFVEKKVKKKTPPRVLFVGNFKWLQNIEAADILINKIWPKIVKEVSGARLWIVGMNIPERIHDLARKRHDIEVTEAIPDIRDAYKAAAIMPVPLRGPGGTRLKVLEALASALPVVSTSIGVMGLGLTTGKHVLVADTNTGLAKESIRLLKNPKLAERIGAEGQKFVAKNYDWRSIIKLHDNIYNNILKKES